MAALRLQGGAPREDGLDALACCAAGIRCLEGRARPLGDADGAIWIPEGICAAGLSARSACTS
ncbi:MAG: hypothetical protein AAGU21_21020 [Solidesulfovibrio sp.]|uniref:hypothetical protein n=1 Tax=Solidesulfovibrio sp. TaxID=2910990 RepID=UPI003158CB71